VISLCGPVFRRKVSDVLKVMYFTRVDESRHYVALCLLFERIE